MELAANTSEYEISYLLDASIPEAEIEAENLRIQTLIVQNGGLVGQTFVPQKKRLFYPIKKQNQAYLGTFYFSAGPDELSKLEKILQLDSKVLRFLILNRAETMQQETGAILTKKPATEKISEETAENTGEKKGAGQSFEEKLRRILKY